MMCRYSSDLVTDIYNRYTIILGKQNSRCSTSQDTGIWFAWLIEGLPISFDLK